MLTHLAWPITGGPQPLCRHGTMDKKFKTVQDNAVASCLWCWWCWWYASMNRLQFRMVVVEEQPWV